MKELPRSRLVSALRTRFESRSLLAVLAVLAALWVASFFTAVRTDVKFTSQGGHLSLTVNERTIRGAETIPPVSRIQIQALNSIFPMGGRTIRVRQGGRVVFEDRLPSRFRVPRGAFRPVGDWYLDPYTGGGIVWERDVAFGGDFTLEATFTGRCSEYTSIILDSGGRRTQLQFRRGMINNDFLINVERQVIAVDALVSPLSRMALDAIDVLVRGGIAACLLILLFMGVSRLRRPDSVGAEAAEPTRAARPLRWTALAVAGIVLGALAIRLWVSRGILLGLAHTPDEVSYMLQGRWLLDNKLYQLASPIQEFLAVPFTYVREGKWFSMYPIGWPMLLVVGQAVGLPWVVSPVCGALYVLLLYLIGRDLYGKPVGLVAAVLGALSPMAILMFSSYLSHGAAALMIALFVWLFVVGRQRASPWVLALAGVSLGFAFGIRPVTAVAIAVPFGLLVLWELRRSSDRALSFRLLAALVGGGIIGSLPVFIANHLITGNALSFAYNYAQIQTYTRQGLPASLMFLDATFAYIPPTAFGWGWGVLPARVLVPLALAFVFVPFLVRRPRPIELAVGAMLVVLPVSFLGWPYHGMHGYGPRFYFEAFLPLYVLSARGFFLLAGLADGRSPVPVRWNPRALLAAVLFAGLVLSTAITLPSRLKLYDGYNFVNGDLEAAIERQGISRAVVLLGEGEWFPWGQASARLTAKRNTDIVFAAARPGTAKLAAFYPDRPIDRWEPATRVLSPVAVVSPAAVAPTTGSPTAGERPPRFTTVLIGWFGFVATSLGLPMLLALRFPRGREKLWRARSRPPVSESKPSDGAPPVAPAVPATLAERSGLRPWRVLAALAGILAAYVGQWLLVPGPFGRWLPASQVPKDGAFQVGWMLLVAGGLLFGFAWRAVAHERTEPAEEGDAAPREPARMLVVRIALAAVSLGLCLWNDWTFYQRGETPRTRIVWGLSLLLFLLALLPRPGRRGADKLERAGDLPRLPALLLLGAVVVMAFLLRFVDLAHVPLDVHGDFTSVGLAARDILRGPGFHLFDVSWANLPVVTFLPTAFTMSLFGDNLFGMNMEAVLMGTAMVLGIYCLASLLFSRTVGVIAAAASAVGYTEIHFSRVNTYIDPAPFIVFGLYFLIKGLRTGSRMSFAMSGFSIAIAFELYYSGRLIAVVLVAFVLYLGLVHRDLLRRRWQGLAILIVAGFLITGPLLVFHWRHRDSFMTRTREVWALAPFNVVHLSNKFHVDPSRVLVEQFWRSALTFNYTGDSSTQFGFAHPMVNPLLAPMLVLGAGVCAFRLRGYGAALLLLWLSLGVVVGSTLTLDAPFWPRLVILLPAVAILIGVGLFCAAQTVLAFAPSRLPSWLALVPAAGMLAWVGYQNWQWYFHGSVSRFAAPIAWMGRLVGESPPGTKFCMIRGPLDFLDRVPQFLGDGRDMLEFGPEELDKFLPRCVAEGRTWILIRPDHDAALARLNAEWPGARQVRRDYPQGVPGPVLWYPPAAAVRNGRAPAP